ncbi:MAG TPA: peptidylprolyl isomerase [Conexibacter sp.]|nr:peptidylprolyl isomerase [Conexibacter sp.]
MRTPRPLLLVTVLLGALALVMLAGCGDSDDGGGSDTAQEPAATTAETSGPCEVVELPAPRNEPLLRKPKERLDPSREWTATVTTNCGTFTIGLDVARAPKTAASFASLARRGFYDDLTFHRIAPGFVIQGGDPLGTGTGGPGYTIVEKPPRDLQYTHGVVAMAKTNTEPDGASGSQFFVVTGEDGGLPPQYALVGTVVDGLDVVDTIGASPIDTSDPQGSRPVDPVVIESVEIAGR